MTWISSCELIRARRQGLAHHLPTEAQRSTCGPKPRMGNGRLQPPPPPSMGPQMQEGLRPRSPSPRGETTSTRCLVGLRFQGKQAELPARKGGSPLPSPETGQQPRPPGRAGVLPSCSSGGCRERGAPLPQPSPSPTACRWACQLLSKRQSSVTRGQAFLSFWNNFQTLIIASSLVPKCFLEMAGLGEVSLLLLQRAAQDQ